jgi:hypothetical protein
MRKGQVIAMAALNCDHVREQCHVILALLDDIEREGLDGYTYVDLEHSLRERLQRAVQALVESVSQCT